MSDEMTEPTVTDEEPVTEAPTTTEEQPPEVDPALLERIKKLDPETLKNLDNLDEFYKRVNRKSMEAAELKKQAEALLANAPSQKAATVDDDEVGLDEKAQEVLRKFLQKELGPVFNTLATERQEQQQQAWQEFVDSHTDVPADAVYDAFYELGFDKTATTPAKYVDAIKKAYKYAKANTVDLEALAEAKAAEKLAALKDKGEEVVAVKEKKSSIEPPSRTIMDIINDDSISWQERDRILNSIG